MIKRFRREDWLDFGLQRLAEHGPDALRLNDLCEAAGRTIGSFYHHFKDQSVFFEALLAHWRKTNSTDVIAGIEALPRADMQAERLNVVAAAMNQSVEVGIRSFAGQNAQAATVVAEVDRSRIAYLGGLYQRDLGLGQAEAQLLAELEYAAFVGTQMIWRDGTLKRGQALSDLFQSMVAAHFHKPAE